MLILFTIQTSIIKDTDFIVSPDPERELLDLAPLLLLSAVQPTPLGVIGGFELLRIDFEEFIRFLRMLTRDIVESRRRDVIGLSLTYERVVLEEILQLGVVARGLCAQDSLGLGPKIC